MKRILTIIMMILVFISCKKNRETVIYLNDKEIEYKYDSEVEHFLSKIGVIDITELFNPEIIGKLNFKIGSTDINNNEIVTFLYIDKNMNNFLDEQDVVSLVPNNFTDRKMNFLNLSYLHFFNLSEKVKLYGMSYELNIPDKKEFKISLVKLQEKEKEYQTYPYVLPDIVLQKVNDDEYFNLSKFKNKGKLIYIEFWGTWCKPCIKLIPEIKQLHKLYSDEITIISVSCYEKSESNLKEFIEKNNMNWIQASCNDLSLRDFGEVSTFPSGFLFNPEGRLLATNMQPNQIIKILNKSKS